MWWICDAAHRQERRGLQACNLTTGKYNPMFLSGPSHVFERAACSCRDIRLKPQWMDLDGFEILLKYNASCCSLQLDSGDLNIKLVGAVRMRAPMVVFIFTFPVALAKAGTHKPIAKSDCINSNTRRHLPMGPRLREGDGER